MYLGYPFVVEKFIVLTGNGRRLARRRAFKKARKKIEHATRAREDKNLYAIFNQLFQELGYASGLPPFDILINLMGTQCEQSENWVKNDFFERITHAAYAQSDSNNTDELCRMAKQWIERLEKTI
jgi:hypothetical protein